MAFLIPEIAEVGAEAGAEAGAESAAEGSAAAEEEGAEAPGGEHNLGNGNSMHFSPEQFKALLHSSAAVAAILDRGQKCAEIANGMAITKGAKYAVSLQNKPDTSRARAAVYAANFKAVVDELNHSTLLKAAAQTGSDPKMQGSGSGESEHEHEGGDEPVKGAEEAAGEASAAEGSLGEAALGEI
jgi:hypothetical protein